MATFEAKPFKKIRNAVVKVGWMDTGPHPGYDGKPPTGETIAQIAKKNSLTRDFALMFDEKVVMNNPEFKKLLQKDIDEAMKEGIFLGRRIQAYLEMGLIETIALGDWAPNSPQWLAFKAAHGLSLEPLIASQVMLDSITTRVEQR